MTPINVYSSDTPTHEEGTLPAPIGSFETDMATYWQGSGVEAIPTPDGLTPIAHVSRDTQRLWLTRRGEWVITDGADGPCHFLSDGQARAWFAACGYDDACWRGQRA